MIEDKLTTKIKSLYEVAKLYEELSKKTYDYQYRLDAIYEQLEILEELKDGSNNIINNWKQCYEEDIAELNK